MLEMYPVVLNPFTVFDLQQSPVLLETVFGKLSAHANSLCS